MAGYPNFYPISMGCPVHQHLRFERYSNDPGAVQALQVYIALTRTHHERSGNLIFGHEESLKGYC
jgi:hypothetical protein